MKFTKKELIIKNASGKDITMDITVPVSKTPVPVLVFCHGFKGFKDWGHFNKAAEVFAENGLACLKFNFSMNGVKSSDLSDISDPDAFSENNYSIELNDLGSVIDYVEEHAEELNLNAAEIYLAGHSRGGGIALLKASEDKRIKKLVLWASLSEFDSFFRPETIEEWNKKGVVNVPNKRTGKDLPLKRQIYDDYQKNKKLLDLRNAAKLLSVPLLIIHGDKDESVPYTHAEALYTLVQHSVLIKVEGEGHTFGASHPFSPETDMTEVLEELYENTYEFLLD